MRGGVSEEDDASLAARMSSPRAWGCFPSRFRGPPPARVFPTCVGVFLAPGAAARNVGGLPHVRGGVSTCMLALRPPIRSSPRAWGCFPKGEHHDHYHHVFPTCVGVFLEDNSGSDMQVSLPHVRGGVSAARDSGAADIWSSPRAWGCFRLAAAAVKKKLVFPTCVGVFLFLGGDSELDTSLPHVRGGVSSYRTPAQLTERSSPRAWGCFTLEAVRFYLFPVFPTCVGVFLSFSFFETSRVSLPHVRGGVSLARAVPGRHGRSSPRAWGCFWVPRRGDILHLVFPTCVGVFLSISTSQSCSGSLPHVRGGVSSSVPC